MCVMCFAFSNVLLLLLSRREVEKIAILDQHHFISETIQVMAIVKMEDE